MYGATASPHAPLAGSGHSPTQCPPAVPGAAMAQPGHECSSIALDHQARYSPPERPHMPLSARAHLRMRVPASLALGQPYCVLWNS
jgi:hypothetical protein